MIIAKSLKIQKMYQQIMRIISNKTESCFHTVVLHWQFQYCLLSLVSKAVPVPAQEFPLPELLAELHLSSPQVHEVARTNGLHETRQTQPYCHSEIKNRNYKLILQSLVRTSYMSQYLIHTNTSHNTNHYKAVNSLPDLVTSAPSVAVFRSRLKPHLFNISYPIPVRYSQGPL